MKKILLSSLLLCLAFVQGLAQLTVKGIITDEKNNPLPGATAVIKNTQRGTFSDATGSYSISAAANDTIVFSMLGMTPQTIPVQGRSVINVKLSEETTALN